MFWFMLMLAVAGGLFVWWKVGWKEGAAAMGAGFVAVVSFFSDLFHNIGAML